MNINTENPKFQDFNEVFSHFDTLEKCYNAIQFFPSLYDPIKGYDRDRQATLLFDFVHFLHEARPLFEKALGVNFLNAPILRWGVQFAEKDRQTGQKTGKLIKRPLNPDTRTPDKWQEGKSLTALQVINALLTGDNWKPYFGKKEAVYNLAILPEALLVIDVDFHAGDTYDPRAEFISWLQEQRISCLLETTPNGVHAWFVNHGEYSSYKKGLSQILLKNGEPLKVEILACKWIEAENKYEGGRSCFLGCERVKNYAENCRLLNYDEGKDIDFRLPTALHVTAKEETGNKRNSIKTQGRNDKQKAAVKLMAKTGFLTNETFSTGRHERIFHLCRLYQLICPEMREEDLIAAVVDYNRERHDPAYSDQEAERLARDGYKAVWTTEKALADLDDYLHKLCKIPKDGVIYALERLGVSLALNEMNQRVYDPRTLFDDLDSLTTKVHNVLRSALPAKTICPNLVDLAKENSFHPVRQYLESLPTSDDDTELRKIYRYLQIEQKPFEREFFRKWLLQAVCALYNGIEGDFYPIDYVLVLQGKQGAGKSSLFQHLAMKAEYFQPNRRLNPTSCDSIREATSAWITELGEIESTTKKTDVGDLKGFISLPRDTYRIPYETSSKSYPRRTVFCGTVNPAQFLRDETGNRRFLPIALPEGYKIPYADIKAIDTDSLWAYIYTQVKTLKAEGIPYSEMFRLTSEEIDYLEQVVEQYRTPNLVEAEISNLMFSSPTNETLPVTFAKTSTQIANDLPFSFKPKARELGEVLTRLGFKTSSHGGLKKFKFWLTAEQAAETNKKLGGFTDYDPTKYKRQGRPASN